MATGNFFKHWPTMLLGVVVAVILLIAVFSYQLNQTESAVVTTFGSPAAVTDPGLHFRWPFPFQKIYKFDHRIRCFEGGSGKIEETMTADGQNILVGIFINYRISAVEKFFRTLEDMTKAEERLNSLMRSAKNATFGQYKFSQVINTKPELMKLNEIQDRIKAALEKDTAEYGIEIVSVGINTINVPERITDKVFDRMIEDRKLVADRYLAEGTVRASEIRNDADQKKAVMLAKAEAEAREIRAQGDAEAATFYAVFRENPELAEFLRKLDSLRLIMRNQTTLVLDTNVAPFDLLKPGSEVLGPVKSAAKDGE
ncbi:protease modulator HflC [Victivallaceae bacterium BBE-744-WT-12]|jgi:band 7 protein|uniref:Protein HflC n=1 Tax=Victivallis lenta TaxID=2606640 RepID=A0A844G707_9BACT|nr:protease modulator HflC [Victivallis lenta]MBS5531814.1 protease modulator HflC [bacterium]MST99710.1 protease modulator HflC [Victivallis lenta]